MLTLNKKLAAKWAAIAGVQFPEKKLTPQTDAPASHLLQQRKATNAAAAWVDAPPADMISSKKAAEILKTSDNVVRNLFYRRKLEGAYFHIKGQKGNARLYLSRKSVGRRLALKLYTHTKH